MVCDIDNHARKLGPIQSKTPVSLVGPSQDPTLGDIELGRDFLVFHWN